MSFLEKGFVFLHAKESQSLTKNATFLLGYGYDGSSSFRPGSRFGPMAIREASINLESYSSYLNRDLLETEFYDLGDLTLYPSRFDIMCEHFSKLTQNIHLKQDHIRLITLGGEHSISYAPISLYLKHYPNLCLIHLDAHADLRESYLEDKFSHACIIKRVIDQFGDDHQILQYGIRSGTREEFQWMEKNQTLYKSLDDLLIKIESLSQEIPIYLTLDLDFFDPSILPGTGTPEAGGASFSDFIKILKKLAHRNLVGADVVELSPHYDQSGQSSCMASKIVREIILAMN